jgi:hypothetical protein
VADPEGVQVVVDGAQQAPQVVKADWQQRVAPRLLGLASR